jgi:hypothetical protein
MDGEPVTQPGLIASVIALCFILTYGMLLARFTKPLWEVRLISVLIYDGERLLSNRFQ